MRRCAICICRVSSGPVESRHATRLRLEIAALQLEIGEVGAAAEIGAASAVSNELGSDKLKKRATALQQRL